MAAQRPEGPGENGTPIPRDPPDQQADGGEDPWDIGDPETSGQSGGSGGSGGPTGSGEDASDVPDTDEAGTGRQGAPRAGSGQTDRPVPEEPAD
ncbi:hypothetical protein [Streptomyces sp. 303MFCol5.2]|uniref:hypothetical protein n=1 Tax=Streptomyces sp. 303MFCol5.2 TaxID=1172181 RepID=UPI000366EEAE|nr:hypothetical protein [Streptomyces sp. 303MFCol5.2]